VRAPVWIPKTGTGIAVAFITGLAIAAIVYVVLGLPSLSGAKVGTQASRDEMNSIAVVLLVAVPAGTWIGVRAEGIREARRRSRAAVMGDLLGGFAARGEAREQAAQAAIWGQPWAAEAMKRRDLGRKQAGHLQTAWDGLDPYLCLAESTLVRHGFTTLAEVDGVRDQVLSGRFPARWDNPMLLRDLQLLEPHENALVRIGIWATHNPEPNSTAQTPRPAG
jgi:hypothetical protein